MIALSLPRDAGPPSANPAPGLSRMPPLEPATRESLSAVREEGLNPGGRHLHANLLSNRQPRLRGVVTYVLADVSAVRVARSATKTVAVP